MVWLNRGRYAPRAEINRLILKKKIKIDRKKACRTGISTYTKILSLAMMKTPSTNRRGMVPRSAFARAQPPHSYWLHVWLHNVPSVVILACWTCRVQHVLSNNLNMSSFLFRLPSAFRCWVAETWRQNDCDTRFRPGVHRVWHMVHEDHLLNFTAEALAVTTIQSVRFLPK